MDERQQFNIASVLGNKVLLKLHPRAYEMLQIQGVESERFVAKVVGMDNFGLWIENPSYCNTPVYTEDGEYIPREERKEVCERAAILLRWGYLQTILQFPDRPGTFQTEDEPEIGFRARLRPSDIMPDEVLPIGVKADEGGMEDQPLPQPAEQTSANGKPAKQGKKKERKRG